MGPHFGEVLIVGLVELGRHVDRFAARRSLLGREVPEVTLGFLEIAERTLVDRSLVALQPDGLLVVAIFGGGGDGVRGSVTGGAVDAASTVSLAVAVRDVRMTKKRQSGLKVGL